MSAALDLVPKVPPPLTGTPTPEALARWCAEHPLAHSALSSLLTQWRSESRRVPGALESLEACAHRAVYRQFHPLGVTREEARHWLAREARVTPAYEETLADLCQRAAVAPPGTPAQQELALRIVYGSWHPLVPLAF